MFRAKTIDELYEEVKDYDYVITNDAPLATALNARIDDFRLDGFAYTPKLLASILETVILRGKTLSDLEAIEQIEHETGYDFRFIHSEMENIRDIRKYTSDVKKYLFSNRSNAIYDSFMTLPTRLKVMDIYDPTVYRSFLTGKKVAVIGLELFDDLDKHMLPVDFDEIEPFTRERFEIDTIHAIGNDRQIAGSIVDLIPEDACNDTAIVLDSGGAIADAVRSALYRKGYPFKNSLDVKDLAQVRDFIQFLTLALDFNTVRIGDVRELISVFQFGKNSNKMRELNPQDDKYLLSRFVIDDDTEPVTKRIITAMRDIREMTFGFAMDELFQNDTKKTSVAILLRNMKLEDRKITSKLVNRLSYAVNNITDLKHNEQVPDDERKGVLLADCKKAQYIDRSFVIFIGMDDAWENSAAGKDYVDKQKLDEDNAYRMSILLQQGSTRVYAVKPVTKGKETVPCTTFQTISAMDGTPRNISSFRDICTTYTEGSWFSGTKEKQCQYGEVSLDNDDSREWRFSKSAYNAYKDCPIKYMLSKILSGEDNEYTVFGNCLHAFAEFYFCYPEIVRNNGLDYYIDRLDQLYAGISNECERELDISRFRVYINNLTKYIDTIRPENLELTRNLAKIKEESKDHKDHNVFMADAGVEFCSEYAEDRKNGCTPLFMQYDVCFGNRIYDYKTGKAKEAKEIIEGFREDGTGLSEFQSMIYLTALLESDRRYGRFELFFLGDNDIASTRDGYDISQNVRTIRLCEDDGIYLALGPSGTLRDDIEGTKKYATFYDNWHSVSEILIRHAREQTLDTVSVVDQIIVASGLKDGKGNRDNAGGLIKKARAMVSSPYLINGEGEVLIPSDTLERFVRKLTEDHARADAELSLPIYDLKKGKIPCRNCSYSRACMKAHEEEEESE